MTASSFSLTFGFAQAPLTAHEAPHWQYRVRKSSPSRRWSSLSFVAVIIIVATASSLTLISQAEAATVQAWRVAVLTPPPRSVPLGSLELGVEATGSFSGSGTIVVPPNSCAVRVSDGRIQGVSVTFDFSSPGCALAGSGTATLNVPFPNATSFTGEGTADGLNFRFTATCVSGCPGRPPLPEQVARARAGAAQAATLGTIALMSVNVQTTNIGIRLSALRRGAGGVSVSGVTLNIDGQEVPLGTFVSLMPSSVATAGSDGSSPLRRLGIFAAGQGSFGDQDATSGEPGFDFHTTGITVGADYLITNQVVLGLAFGYLRTKADMDLSAGESKTDGYSVSAYGTYHVLEKLYLDGIATFGWNRYDTERNIVDTDATAKGSTDGNQFAISVSTGYNFNVGALSFGPTGRVNYVLLDIDSFRERGAELFELRIDGQTIQSLTTAVGGQATYAISMPWGVLTPLVTFEWEHEYLGDRRTVGARLVANPTTVGVAQTASPDRDYFNLGAGLSATLKGGVSAFVHFEETLGRTRFANHSFNVGARLEF